MTARQQRRQEERKARKAALKNQSSQTETVSREATAAAPQPENSGTENSGTRIPKEFRRIPENSGEFRRIPGQARSLSEIDFLEYRGQHYK